MCQIEIWVPKEVLLTTLKKDHLSSASTMARGKANELNQSLSLLIFALQIVACAHGGSKNAQFNWAFFILIASLCTYHIFFTASNDAVSDSSSAMNVANFIFTASDFILLRNWQPELRQIGQRRPTSEMSVWERLKWGFNLSVTPRTLGWSSEPTSYIRPKPTSGRVAFIVSQLAWIFFYYIIFDATSMITLSIPIYGKGGPTFAEYGWIWRATIWNHVLNTYTLLSIIYSSASVGTVALGLYQPGDWPHIFGYFSRDGYTVRGMWGRVWHQMLRKPVTSHANALTEILGLPKSKFTAYFQLYVSFFISGLIHFAGDYMLHQDWAGRAVSFFVLQAVGITLEDMVNAIAKRAGLTGSPLAKFMGFCWVIIWFSFSLPWWLERNFHAGSFDEGPRLPSLIMGLWKGDWTPSRM
ncbi:hypothetical protein D9619_011607 [Psilocybe cf. subviscida]|uniref:Wax synthase domain-containing protein n=1 Tax=Psilocybe cf. subviscida TaxID=2480587 RepID=A0A8H5BT14_9AGAR|nr:hypothetical protein D9619_011607 [Psilocybe cf. subviscida]